MKDKKDGNKNNFKEIISTFMGIGIIILVIIGAIKLGELGMHAIKECIKNYPTIAVAIITGLLAFISIPVGKYFENKYTIKIQIREVREQVYVNFLNWLINNLLNGEVKENVNLVQEIKEKQNEIVIYGSDKVLKAWIKFKDTALKMINEYTSQEDKTKYYIDVQAPEIENLIIAIRKELGYRNKNIQRYDILRLYITDVDKYIDKGNK